MGGIAVKVLRICNGIFGEEEMMSDETIEVEPIDVNRCQAEHKPGSFMTLGPRRIVRCKNIPIFIAIEKKPQKKGWPIGAMSLCDKCAEKMKEVMGENYATLLVIKR